MFELQKIKEKYRFRFRVSSNIKEQISGVNGPLRYALGLQHEREDPGGERGGSGGARVLRRACRVQIRRRLQEQKPSPKRLTSNIINVNQHQNV